jgi:mannan endo-1,4-beta-mannosidase
VIRRHAGPLAVAAVGVAAVAVVAAAAVLATRQEPPTPASANVPSSVLWHQQHPVHATLPVRQLAYLGLFESTSPGSYSGAERFTSATGVRPNVALYYSGWEEPFKTLFAEEAYARGAWPFIQIDPVNVSLDSIATGKYDAYLQSYADQVANFRHAVIIGFGHEMNGTWYSWGQARTAPAVFVAAWRHVVDVFRKQGADNVTWLWTVNIIDTRDGILAPGPWWPGSSYVTWVGIDGYYLKPSWTFASLFGPTIRAIRARTLDPILISETGAAPAADQPAKITNLFAGIHAYGLLGFVWFDANGIRDFRLDTSAAIEAIRRRAAAYPRPLA